MGVTCTNHCSSHTANYYKVNCGYHRGRNRGSLTYTDLPETGDIIDNYEWVQLKDKILWERQQRGFTSTTSPTMGEGWEIRDTDIELLISNLESMAGAPNYNRPSSSTYTTKTVTRTDGGALITTATAVGEYSNISGWVKDNEATFQNINDIDYDGVLITPDILITLRDKLNETMADCVCNADCGTHSLCSCFTTHCTSYYY